MRTGIWYYILPAMLLACNNATPPDPEKVKAEVIAAEKSFNDLAAEKGVEEAFLTFAADNAVMVRGEKVISGKEEIRAYMQGGTLKDVKLEWAPDFVDVSESGDMAYTYGKYSFSAVDTTGNPISSTGIFHTVWKKQPDGTWKFVYD